MLTYFFIVDNSGELIVNPENSKFSFPNDIATFIEDSDMEIFNENPVSLKHSLQNSLNFAGTFYNTADNKTCYITTIPMVSKDRYEPTKGHFGIIISEDVVAKNYTDFSKYVTRISVILIISFFYDDIKNGQFQIFKTYNKTPSAFIFVPKGIILKKFSLYAFCHSDIFL